jgi:hypothetical protein
VLIFLASHLVVVAVLILWVMTKKKSSSGSSAVVFEPVPIKAEGDDALMEHLGEVDGYPLARCKRTNVVADPRWLRSLETWPQTRSAANGWT